MLGSAGSGVEWRAMALPSFPPDDPATQQAELGLTDAVIRVRVEEGTARAVRRQRGISEREGLRRLSRVPGFTAALVEVEGSAVAPDV